MKTITFHAQNVRTATQSLALIALVVAFVASYASNTHAFTAAVKVKTLLASGDVRPKT